MDETMSLSFIFENNLFFNKFPGCESNKFLNLFSEIKFLSKLLQLKRETMDETMSLSFIFENNLFFNQFWLISFPLLFIFKSV